MNRENPAVLAKEAIARALAGAPSDTLPWETSLEGLFISLQDADGRVRASYGTSRAERGSGELLARLARQAASADPRFPPLEAEELAELSLKVWVLFEGRPFASLEALGPDDALRVERPPFSGVFLPENYMGEAWDPLSCLKQACRRAGLAAAAFQEEGVSVRVFSTRCFEA